MTKTLIGVLASHDSDEKNKALATVLNEGVQSRRDVLKEFGFVFTGGTFERLFKEPGHLVPATQDFLKDHCGVIVLPPTSRGGVTVMASLVTFRRISILWPFFSPLTTHLLFPENLALLRLADQWRTRKLMNSGSVNEWITGQARRDMHLNQQDLSLDVELPGTGVRIVAGKDTEGFYRVTTGEARDHDFMSAKANGGLDTLLGRSVVALISHDEMKSRMLDFVVDHEKELGLFRKILATGTTGALVRDAAPSLANKIHRYHSGPKGGDVEIATEILFDGCHVVIFFVDPLHPHPHTEDIRVVFGACMIHDHVRMLSNEAQARDWMDRVVRVR